MADLNPLRTHPAAVRAAETLKALRVAPYRQVNPLVQLAVWWAEQPGVDPDLEEQAVRLLGASEEWGVSLLLPDLAALEAETEQQPSGATGLLLNAMDALTPLAGPDGARRLLENLDANLRSVYPSYGRRPPSE